MSVFLLVNNASTVTDVTPAAIFLEKGAAIKALYEYEKASVFRPIVLYEYTLVDGFAQYPSCFHRVKRDWKSIVEGIETIPIQETEFRKMHPFIFDKLTSFANPSDRIERAL